MDHKSDNLPHFTLWAFLQQLRLHISRRSVIYLLLPMYPNEVPFMAATCSPVFQEVTYLNLCADVAEFSAVIQPWAMCSKLSLPAMTLWSRDSDLGWQPHSCLILSHRLGTRPFACITTTTSRAGWRHTWLFKCGTRLFARITKTTSRAGLRHG